MAYRDEVLADSPGMYLRLGETSGTNANDETANNNDGTYTNSSGYTLGEASLLSADPDKSVRLTRANTGYVWVADAATLDLGDTFTLEAWIKLAALGQATNKAIVSKQNGGYYMRITTADKISLVCSQNAVIATQTAALASTGPFHVVWTKNGGTVVLYVNGVTEPFTSVTPFTCTNNAARLMVGADGTGNNVPTETFDGWIDEVAVYPTALSAARIAAHYTAATSAGAPAVTALAPQRMLMGVGQ